MMWWYGDYYDDIALRNGINMSINKADNYNKNYNCKCHQMYGELRIFFDSQLKVITDFMVKSNFLKKTWCPEPPYFGFTPVMAYYMAYKMVLTFT